MTFPEFQPTQVLYPPVVAAPPIELEPTTVFAIPLVPNCGDIRSGVGPCRIVTQRGVVGAADKGSQGIASDGAVVRAIRHAQQRRMTDGGLIAGGADIKCIGTDCGVRTTGLVC